MKILSVKFFKLLQKFLKNNKIFLINDGSTDATKKKLQKVCLKKKFF